MAFIGMLPAHSFFRLQTIIPPFLGRWISLSSTGISTNSRDRVGHFLDNPRHIRELHPSYPSVGAEFHP